MSTDKMQSFNPLIALEPRQWRLLDEHERIDLVVKYHHEASIELPDEYAHALLHVVVEIQIAQGDETPVEAVLRRLTDENLDRHDAVHAIASILANHIFELMHGDDAALGNDEYYAELEKLTAEKWQRGDLNKASTTSPNDIQTTTIEDDKIIEISKILTAWNPLGERAAVMKDLEKRSSTTTVVKSKRSWKSSDYANTDNLVNSPILLF